MTRFVRCSVLLLALCGAVACSSDDNSPAQVNLDDAPEEVTVEVGKMGATLIAKGVRLTIPEGALDKNVKITAKNVGRMAEPPSINTKQISDRFEFGPSGTKFNKDVQVTFSTDKFDARAVVHFSKEDDPNSFEELDTTVEGKQVFADVRHFSSGFVGVPADALDGGTAIDAGEQLPDADSADDAGGEADAELVDATTVPSTTRITVNSRDRYGVLVNQTWAAYQDGDGQWQLLAPSATGVYSFDVSAPRFAVAFVCAESPLVKAWGTLNYEPATTTTLDVVTLGTPCTAGTAPATYGIEGTVNLGSFTYWRIGNARLSGAGGFSTVPASYNTGDFANSAANDLMFSAGPNNTDAVARILIERNVTLSANLTGHYLDTVKDGFNRLGVNTAQATNGNGNTTLQVRYTTRGTEEGLVLNTSDVTGSAARAVSFATVPEARRLPTDRYVLVADDTTSSQWRHVTWSTYATDNLSLNMPYAFSLSFSGQTTPYFRPVFSFPHLADAGRYTFSSVYSPVRGSDRQFTIDVNPAALEGTASHQIVFPDFSQVTGFNMGWVAPVGATLSVRGSVKVTKSDASGTFSAELGQISSLQ